MIHIFQRSWPNPSADQLLHFLPFHNEPNLQLGRSGRAAWLCEPHASEPAATKHTEPGLRELEFGELQGWFTRLRWPWLPDASTRSLRDGLEARLAARVTRKSWAERSLWPRCASQGVSGVPSGACSSVGLTAWPHVDVCFGTGRPQDGQTDHHPANASSQPHRSAASAEVTGGTATYSIQCLSLSHASFKYILKAVITRKIAEGAKTKAQSHQKQLSPSVF